MKKINNKGASALRSLIALVTMAAVLVISLPAFKMDVEAVNGYTYYYEDYDFTTTSFNYLIGLESSTGLAPTAFVLGVKSGNSFQNANNTGTLPAGTVIMLPRDYMRMYGEIEGASVNLDALINNSEGTVDQVASNNAGEAPLDIILLTLTAGISYTIDGLTVTITGPATEAGSSETPAPAPAPAASAGQPMDSATLARLWAEFNAWLAARDQAIRAGQEAAKIRKDQQAQIDRDNFYFRNLNEAIRNGKSMVVFSDHSALRSQINGTYLANSVPGFAALFMGLPNPNLHIETWNITSKNAPDAVNAINGVAEQNGYTVGAMLQVNIGEKGPDGKPVYESTNKEPVANIVMGVPNSIRGDDAEYGAVQVLPGGEIHMYKDLPFNDNAVSLPLGIGRSAIGLVQTN